MLTRQVSELIQLCIARQAANSFFFLNLADDTLQNCTLELATLGDLKLVERPHPVVLAPHDFCNIKANVKVSSTENGIIFGNIGERFG